MLWLEIALTTLLGRESHERRAHVRRWVEQNGECAKCHSHESRRFSRNGSRPRTLHYLDFTLLWVSGPTKTAAKSWTGN